jgi:hypothetical protein
MNRAVGRMKDRRLEPGERVVGPLDVEAVSAQSLVFASEPGQLCLVGRQTPASDAPERAAPERRQPLEAPLGQPPIGLCPLSAELPARDVVRHRAASKRETAVASARAARHVARLVEAYAQAALGQCEGARAARHAAADHGHVRRPGEPDAREGVGLLVEPEGDHAEIVGRASCLHPVDALGCYGQAA